MVLLKIYQSKFYDILAENSVEQFSKILDFLLNIIFYSVSQILSLFDSLTGGKKGYSNPMQKKSINQQQLSTSILSANSQYIIDSQNAFLSTANQKELANATKIFDYCTTLISKMSVESNKRFFKNISDLLFSPVIGEARVMINQHNAKLKNHGFVGLINPASLCYINSVLQVIFTIAAPQLVNLDDCAQSCPVGEKKVTANQVEYNKRLLMAVKSLFTEMIESVKSEICISPLTDVYVMNGTRINVLEQNDSMEFFNSFVDSIDEALKMFGKDTIFEPLMSGKLVNKIESQNCNHHKAREELFYSISLDVSDNFSCIKDSLDNFIKVIFYSYTNYIISSFIMFSAKIKCSCCVEDEFMPLHFSLKALQLCLSCLFIVLPILN